MDTKELFALIEKFDESGLSEIKYKTSEDAIVLRKGFEPLHGSPVSAPMHPAPQQVAHDLSAGDENNDGFEIVPAPIVGTFYRSPSPDSPPFVEEGSTIKSGETICILEAMKVMNKLEADFDMEIINILVESGDMVEYGTPLLRVKRL